MYKKRSPAYLRIPFVVSEPERFDVLRLQVKMDDGFIAYLNGHEVARENALNALERKGEPRASSTRPDHEGNRSARYDIREHLDALRPGRNLLAILALNVNPRSSDMLLIPKLEGGVSSTLPSPAGAEVYYSLDGTDPRQPGGGLTRGARRYREPPVLTGQRCT